jgi:hypothetical protein
VTPTRPLAWLAGVALLSVLAAGCSSAPPLAHRGKNATPPPTSAPPGTAIAAHGPQPPATGAWVGAWVKPAKATELGRLDAVAQFEQTVGHPLGLVHVYHTWSQAFPDAADVQFLKQGKQLMISWSGTSTSSIVSGLYDDMIRTRAEAVKALGLPVLLRWRWEMNRPNLDSTIGTPAEYVQAWKHIRAIFDQVGATNVGWVWCPLAGNFTATDAAAYYPGDDQVDWLCTDVYAIGSTKSFADVAAGFMAWAAGHDKPIVVGEYGSELTDPTGKQTWIEGATAYAKAHPQIKAMVYFDAQRTENGQQRDFRVESASGPLSAFEAMLADTWFQQKA